MKRIKALSVGLIRGLIPVLGLSFFWQTRINLFNSYEIYDYLIPFVYLTDILILLVILFEFILHPDWLINFIQRKKWWSFLMLAFVLQNALLVFVLGVPHPVAGVYHLFKLVLMFLFSLWVVQVNTRFHPGKFLTLISLGLVPLLCLGFAEILLGKTLGIKLIGEWSFSVHNPAVARVILWGKEVLRPYASFPHPNVFGGVMAVFALVWWARWIKKTDPRDRKFELYQLFLFGFGVVISFSRTALFAFLTGLLFLWVRRRLDEDKSGSLFQRIRLVHLLVFGILIGILFMRVRLLFLSEQVSWLRRVELAKIAFEVWWRFPLIGVGLSQFIIYLGQYWVSTDLSRFIQPVHDVYLLVLAETGIFGLLEWLGIIGLPLMTAWRKLSLEVVGIWWVIIITSLFDHYWWTLQAGQLLFFLTLGVTLATIKAEKPLIR